MVIFDIAPTKDTAVNDGKHNLVRLSATAQPAHQQRLQGLVRDLVSKRLIACAQLGLTNRDAPAASTLNLSMKTTAECAGKVDAILRAPANAQMFTTSEYTAFRGNADYEKWLVDECSSCQGEKAEL